MDNEEIWHIIIEPSTNIEPNLIAQLAKVLNKDLYSTRYSLVGKIPKIIAHYKDAKEANRIAEQLSPLGIQCFIYPNSELRKMSAAIFRAYSLRFDQEYFVLEGKNMVQKVLNTGTIFLIIKGKTQSYIDKVIIKTKTKLNLSATLLTGGIPISKKITEKTITAEQQIGYFIRLYPKDGKEPAIEIERNSFNYSGLGARLSTDASINFNTLLKLIQELYPEAIVDERLVETLRPTMYSDTSREDRNLHCTLIWLAYREQLNRRRP
jgi:hypothetical protein